MRGGGSGWPCSGRPADRSARSPCPDRPAARRRWPGCRPGRPRRRTCRRHGSPSAARAGRRGTASPSPASAPRPVDWRASGIQRASGPTGPTDGRRARSAHSALDRDTAATRAVAGSSIRARPEWRRPRQRLVAASSALRSQANGRGAFGSSGVGGWRQGGTFPTSGTRCCNWPIPSTRPCASASRGRQRLGRRPVAAPLEELGEPAVRLQVAPDHHRVVRLERLGHPVDERPREPQRVAHLADRRPRPVRDEVADHPRVLRAVAPVDVLDDLLAPRRAEVDVDVRVGRPARVDEPLEQEVVGDRLDPADPEGVRHDRAGRAAPALGRDPPLLREAHQVPADEEELGETGPLDDVELVGEPLDDRRGQRVVAAAGRPDQHRFDRYENGVSPSGHREAREAVLLELEVDRRRTRRSPRTARCPRARPAPPTRSIDAPERRQLVARLEVRLAIGSAQVGQRVERPAVLDRGQDVVELAVLASGVVDGVGDDDRQPQVRGPGPPTRRRASRRRGGGGGSAR